MRTIILCVTLLLLPTLLFAGENWNQFRGPRGEGIGQAKNLPAKFGEKENVTWKTAIHGKGWSSPVVWDNQIWMGTATEDGKELFAVCADLETGKILHDIKLFDVAEPRFCHPTNSYASCTPVIEQGRVYFHFGSYGTACLDTATGKKLWERRDLICDHFRGPASSPVIYQDLLFINFDGVDQQYVVAFDKNTGKTVWKKTRNIDYKTDNGDRKKAYGTASVVEVDGRVQVVSTAAMATIAYDPLNGNELWKVRHGGMNGAARAILSDGMLFINPSNGLFSMKPDGSGDVTDTHVKWTFKKSVPRRGSHLLVDGLIYMFNDGGVATCVDSKTGEQIWQKRIDGKYWSSPIYADGKIYAAGKDGFVVVLKASREFKLLATNKLDSGVHATPAVADNALILRSNTHLYRIEKKKK